MGPSEKEYKLQAFKHFTRAYKNQWDLNKFARDDYDEDGKCQAPVFAQWTRQNAKQFEYGDSGNNSTGITNDGFARHFESASAEEVHRPRLERNPGYQGRTAD